MGHKEDTRFNMKAPSLWVCVNVCGWTKVYQITTAEEWKVCAERQPVKVSQEAVNSPIKSTRSDKPPKSANTSRGHSPPTSAKIWLTWAWMRGQELLPTDRDCAAIHVSHVRDPMGDCAAIHVSHVRDPVRDCGVIHGSDVRDPVRDCSSTI